MIVALAAAAERTTPVGPDLDNARLHEQVEDDPARVLPRSPLFAAAVDIHGFYRFTWNDSFSGLYHSGIWIDVYGEARPFPDFAANLRLSVLNPGSSYGIVAETDVVAWPQVSWTPTFGEVRGEIRIFDIGRRTLGAGLVVQEQEGSGLAAQLSWRALRTRMAWFGTDTFSLEGDFLGAGVDVADDAVGVWGFGTLSWTGGYGAALYTAHPFPSGVTPLAEAAIRWGRPAGLIGIRVDKDPGGWWAGGGTAQVRGYDAGFAEDLTGVVGHDYLAPEQELLDFVRADNVFVYDDGVLLAAGRLWGVVRPFSWLQLRIDQEVARLWWQEPEDTYPTLWWWWRYDVIGCVRRPDNVCLDVFVTNRMTSAVHLPTEMPDTANYPMLYDRPFVGIEARARF